MKFYQLLSGFRLLKSYSSKFMFVAFCGIHVPLVGIVTALLISNGADIKKTSFFLLTLGLTLFATAVTLAILHALTAPLRVTQRQLAVYLKQASVPAIPVEYTDETGLLMRDVSALINRQHHLQAGLKAQSDEILYTLALINNENNAEAIARHTKTIAAAVNKQLQLVNEAGTLRQSA